MEGVGKGDYLHQLGEEGVGGFLHNSGDSDL